MEPGKVMDDPRSAQQVKAEALGMLLGLYVYASRLLPPAQAHHEVTGAVMSTAAVVFDNAVGWEYLRDLVTSVPVWNFPQDQAARDAWVVDHVRSMLSELELL